MFGSAGQSTQRVTSLFFCEVVQLQESKASQIVIYSYPLGSSDQPFWRSVMADSEHMHKVSLFI